MTGPSDPEPSTRPGVDPEIVEAIADDVDQIIAALHVAAHNLENLASGLRREAAAK